MQCVLQNANARLYLTHNFWKFWFMNGIEQSRASPPIHCSGFAIHWLLKTLPGCLLAQFADDGMLSDEYLQSYLSAQEQAQAACLNDPVEQRHFIARRSFQRLFLSEVLAFDKPAAIRIIHQRDTRPVCLDAPDLNLSFSSSGTTFIACANAHNPVGVDIERNRMIPNASALAKRFFTEEEAQALAALPSAQHDLHFLYLWTAKEAALKAIGQGIVFGLNTFSIARVGNSLTYKINDSTNSGAPWGLKHIESVPHHLIAIVEKNYVNKA
jgi:phosphopantetheinyl transferase